MSGFYSVACDYIHEGCVHFMKRSVLSFVLILSIILVGVACSDEKADDEDSVGIGLTYIAYEWDDLQTKAYLGSPEAEHTLLLAFDYACSWCKKWMAEVLPELQASLIDSGALKYYSQAVSLLSQESINLARVDYAVETLYPDHYFELQQTFAAEAGSDGWGSEAYIADRLARIGLSADMLEDERLDGMTDRLRLTRDYTRNRNLQSVPSVYVDGIQVSNPFDIQEIMGIVDGTIRAGDPMPQ